MEMIKFICIKECEAYSSSLFKIKVGEVVLYCPNHLKDLKSEIVFINNVLVLIGMKDFNDCFISLAEWREQQINSILDD